jgi:hypothetical protein
MKRYRIVLKGALLILASCMGYHTVKAQEPAIHCLGNGKMCVYGQGPDIITMYPSPYSTPSLFRMLAPDSAFETSSSREPGAAIWTHELFLKGEQAGTIQDFVDADLPVLVRHMELEEEIQFRLVLNPAVQVLLMKGPQEAGQGEMLLMTHAGTTIYQKYVYPRPLFHLLSWVGPLTISPSGDLDNEYTLSCRPGEIDLFFVGGPEYDEVITHREEAMELTHEAMCSRTREWWRKFTARRTDFHEVLPADLPLRQELLQIIDDVSVMIRTQQAGSGAVMAGYPYPLGYVRDQYGVSRGLLALGYHEEARNILDFYWHIWQRTGELHCAQGIGVDGIFHIHENDEVESPGYLIMQAFDLLEKTGDEPYLLEIFPMLEWCWEVQKKHLAGYMLPFNGDETYVAGGILPRSTLNDGSAEATMLFIEGGGKLLRWAAEQRLWAGERLQKNDSLLAAVRGHFRENFWIGGSLITNNPARLEHTDPPRFRHGVCERGGPHCLVYRTDGFGGIDWTEMDANGRYQCPPCLALGPMPPAETKIYKLISVSLTPLYFSSALIDLGELRPLVGQVYENYKETGMVSSRTGTSAVRENKRSVGYDYGLILYAMLRTGAGNAEDLYRETLSIADETGAWSEYYLDGIPSGTRCRPWESAINLEALIDFAMHYKK